MDVVSYNRGGLSLRRVDLPFDETSPLLHALSENRFTAVWQFAGTGKYPLHKEAKAEFEAKTQQLLAMPEDSLRDIARTDDMLQGGYTMGGSGEFDPDTGDLRTIAIRQVELAAHSKMIEIDDQSFYSPKESDRVFSLVPGLFNRLTTRDHLLPISPEMVSRRRGGSDRVFVDDEYAYFPHPAIRENRELVARLCRLAQDGHKVAIAIDGFRAVPKDRISDVMLADYWWGMELKLDKLDDPTKVGSTRHGRPPEKNKLTTFPLLRTDFRWTSDGRLKTLEVQETLPRTSLFHRSDKFVANRYTHSIRDTQKRKFTHLDGAVKAFPMQHYHPTVEDPEASQGKPVYRKLFRIDGSIPDSEWAPCISQFFRQNELVIEYFGEPVDERPQPVSQ